MGEMVRHIIGDSAGALADRGGGGGGGGGWEGEGPLPPGLASLVRSYAGEAALRRINDDYAASQRYALVPQGPGFYGLVRTAPVGGGSCSSSTTTLPAFRHARADDPSECTLWLDLRLMHVVCLHCASSHSPSPL